MKNEALILTVIVAITLATRLLALGYFAAPLINDALVYDKIAVNIVAGNGFTDGSSYASKPPFYPLSMAAVYTLFGAKIIYVKLLQVFLSLLLCLGVWFLGRQIAGWKVGLIAASLFMADGIFVYFTAQVLSDILFTLLVLAGLLLLIRGFRTERLSAFVFAGILLGLSTLTKGPSLLLPVFMALAAIITYGKKYLKALAVFMIIYGLTLAPWVLRNYRLFDAIVVSSTNGGQNLLEANNPYLRFSTLGDWPVYGDIVKLNPAYQPPAGLNEPAADRYLTKQALSFIVHNPGQTVVLGLAKIVKFWTPWPVYPWPVKIKIMAFLTQGLMVLLAWGGIYLTRQKWRYYLVPLSAILYFTFMHTVFFAMIRYRLVIMPYLYLFAAIVIAQIIDRKTEGRS